jgi:hypothetical protein
MRSRHRIPDPGDGFLPFGHEVGGTTSAGSAYWERTAVASRHRDTVPAIFDDGAVSHKSTLRCALLNVRYAPIATKLRSAAKWRDCARSGRVVGPSSTPVKQAKTKNDQQEPASNAKND